MPVFPLGSVGFIFSNNATMMSAQLKTGSTGFESDALVAAGPGGAFVPRLPGLFYFRISPLTHHISLDRSVEFII